jgi:hypothetical protein
VLTATADVTVTDVSYALAGAGVGDCTGDLPHAVEVFVSPGGVPSPTPSSEPQFQAVQAPGFTPSAASYDVVNVALPTPVVVRAGESLVVMVEMSGTDDGHRLCIGSCFDSGGTVGVGFWSNSATEPYPWGDMVSDFGFTSDFFVYAGGTVD